MMESQTEREGCGSEDELMKQRQLPRAPRSSVIAWEQKPINHCFLVAAAASQQMTMQFASQQLGYTQHRVPGLLVHCGSREEAQVTGLNSPESCDYRSHQID